MRLFAVYFWGSSALDLGVQPRGIGDWGHPGLWQPPEARRPSFRPSQSQAGRGLPRASTPEPTLTLKPAELRCPGRPPSRPAASRWRPAPHLTALSSGIFSCSPSRIQTLAGSDLIPASEWPCVYHAWLHAYTSWVPGMVWLQASQPLQGTRAQCPTTSHPWGSPLGLRGAALSEGLTLILVVLGRKPTRGAPERAEGTESLGPEISSQELLPPLLWGVCLCPAPTAHAWPRVVRGFPLAQLLWASAFGR